MGARSFKWKNLEAKIDERVDRYALLLAIANIQCSVYSLEKYNGEQKKAEKFFLKNILIEAEKSQSNTENRFYNSDLFNKAVNFQGEKKDAEKIAENLYKKIKGKVIFDNEKYSLIQNLGALISFFLGILFFGITLVCIVYSRAALDYFFVSLFFFSISGAFFYKYRIVNGLSKNSVKTFYDRILVEDVFYFLEEEEKYFKEVKAKREQNEKEEIQRVRDQKDKKEKEEFKREIEELKKARDQSENEKNKTGIKYDFFDFQDAYFYLPFPFLIALSRVESKKRKALDDNYIYNISFPLHLLLASIDYYKCKHFNGEEEEEEEYSWRILKKVLGMDKKIWKKNFSNILSQAKKREGKKTKSALEQEEYIQLIDAEVKKIDEEHRERTEKRFLPKDMQALFFAKRIPKE
ncbi:MAG TPA: hypothetical protein DDW88_06240 [Treponema sp.]|nr:hypothetical protein [Treponema sp.]